MEILIFNNEDTKKDGTLKKKNNSKNMSEEEFKQYVKDNKLTTSYGYIDLVGTLSNGSRFRCYHNNFVVGVSGIVKELNGDD